MSRPDTEAVPPRKALLVPAEAAGRRLDQWLAEANGAELSRSRIQQLVRDGNVSIDGAPERQPNRRLAAGQSVDFEVPPPEDADPLPEPIPLNVLFEDDAIIVVDKPAGLVVHPAPGHWSGTLVNALMHHCGASLSGIGGVRRPGIVHRLDRDTSGVMVVAKSDAAHRVLSEAFADHGRTGSLERAYTAVAWGAPERNAGTIRASLGRSTKDRTLRAVVPDGRGDAREAITHYAVLERFPAGAPEAVACVLDCRLETGRTHQIRVHLASLSNPLIGDPDYGKGFRTKVARLPVSAREIVSRFPRQALHARLLAFDHPVTGEALRFETPLPADLAELIAALGT